MITNTNKNKIKDRINQLNGYVVIQVKIHIEKVGNLCLIHLILLLNWLFWILWRPCPKLTLIVCVRPHSSHSAARSCPFRLNLIDENTLPSDTTDGPFLFLEQTSATLHCPTLIFGGGRAMFHVRGPWNAPKTRAKFEWNDRTVVRGQVKCPTCLTLNIFQCRSVPTHRPIFWRFMPFTAAAEWRLGDGRWLVACCWLCSFLLLLPLVSHREIVWLEFTTLA